MKSLIIYTSQTGFTKQYAEWIAGQAKADIIKLTDAQKQKANFFEEYQAVAFGGWVMGGKVVKVNWFLDKASAWQNKRLAVFCVGAAPNEHSSVQETRNNVLTNKQREHIQVFYCPGGLNYDKMKSPSKLAMKLFVSVLKKKKNANKEEKQMAAMLSSSYDISDIKYIEPIVTYLQSGY